MNPLSYQTDPAGSVFWFPTGADQVAGEEYRDREKTCDLAWRFGVEVETCSINQIGESRATRRDVSYLPKELKGGKRTKAVTDHEGRKDEIGTFSLLAIKG